MVVPVNGPAGPRGIGFTGASVNGFAGYAGSWAPGGLEDAWPATSRYIDRCGFTVVEKGLR